MNIYYKSEPGLRITDSAQDWDIFWDVTIRKKAKVLDIFSFISKKIQSFLFEKAKLEKSLFGKNGNHLILESLKYN